MSKFQTDFWKSELISVSERVRKSLKNDRHDEHSLFIIERDLTLAALALRKVIEDRNVPDAHRSKVFLVSSFASFPNRTPATDALICMASGENLNVQDAFELEAPHVLEMDAYDISSEFIHSAGVSFNVVDNCVSSVFIASFRNEYKRLLGLHVEDLCDIFTDFGRAQVSRKWIDSTANSNLKANAE